MIRDLFRDQRAIGKDRDQEAFLLGIGVDVQKIPPSQRLATRETDLHTAGLMDLIRDPKDLWRAQFLPKPVRCIEAVRVAHDAAQVAATGQLPLAAQRESPPGEPLR